MPDSDKFSAAIARCDNANRADPNRTTVDGVDVPDELLYAQRMTDCLGRFKPNASEALRLAARAQHIRRWTIPRESYPMDRAGYYRWRTDLGKFHAETAGAILRDVGYDDDILARVQSLLQKQNMKTDPEMQALEDVICLVFLQYEFPDFARKHDQAKLIRILQRTWEKMSERGQEAALALPMSAEARSLVEKAVVGDGARDESKT